MTSALSRISLTLALTSLVAAAAAPAAAGGFAQPPPSARPHQPIDLGAVADAGVTEVGPAGAALRMAPVVIERAALRARLVANRTANLARFRAYRIAGVYPNNVFSSELANVWRDQDGHYCAAATIIRASGETVLVKQVADENNFIKLADVSQGPVMDWILTSGLTQAELALIQRPFRPVTMKPELRPSQPILVDAKLRAAETRRLAARYRQIESRLERQSKASIDAAVNRLLNQPELAQALLAS
ncbi:MAG: hypothetical protein M3680_26770 [Myxococcota bacterium]|nr:hypothetical protein [Myxococcota bacterium]